MYYALLFFLLWVTPTYTHVLLTVDRLDNKTCIIKVDFPLKKGDYIYHDYIAISCDEASISLSPWTPSNDPVMQYDTIFKKNKLIYPSSFTITFNAHTTNPNLFTQLSGSIESPIKPYIHVTYYQKSNNKVTHCCIPLRTTNYQHAAPSASPIVEQAHLKTKQIIEEKKNNLPISTHTFFSYTHHFYTSIMLIILLFILLSLLLHTYIKIYSLPLLIMALSIISYIVFNYTNALLPIPHRFMLLGLATLFLCTGIIQLKRSENKISFRFSCIKTAFFMFLIASSVVLYVQSAQLFYTYYTSSTLNVAF